jgi:hypothetical protein
MESGDAYFTDPFLKKTSLCLREITLSGQRLLLLEECAVRSIEPIMQKPILIADRMSQDLETDFSISARWDANASFWGGGDWIPY